MQRSAVPLLIVLCLGAACAGTFVPPEASDVPATTESALIQADTASIVVLPFDTLHPHVYGFERDHDELDPVELSFRDLCLLETVIDSVIQAQNSLLGTDSVRNKYRLLAREGYVLQVVPVRTVQGDTLVHVNALCGPDELPWRARLIQVQDGGSCYYQLWVDLTRRICLRFAVNGVA